MLAGGVAKGLGRVPHRRFGPIGDDVGHLRSMTQLSEMGAVIAPPVPAFYSRPQSLEDMVTQTVGRVLDLFDLPVEQVRRWQGE